jgi:hypothetical protein
MSSVFANGLTQMMEAKANGLDNAVTRTIHSSSPTHFRRWAEQYLKPAILG